MSLIMKEQKKWQIKQLKQLRITTRASLKVPKHLLQRLQQISNFLSRKKSPKASASKAGPDLYDYITERAAVFDEMSPGELESYKDALKFQEISLQNNKEQKLALTTEANSYDRQFASYFAVAISFIVAALIGFDPGKNLTHASKVLYICALGFALCGALIILFEGLALQRFHRRWSLHLREVGTYISTGGWRAPRELNNWIHDSETNLPRHSPTLFTVITIILVGISFILLLLWQVEVQFNPNWPIY